HDHSLRILVILQGIDIAFTLRFTVLVTSFTLLFPDFITVDGYVRSCISIDDRSFPPFLFFALSVHDDCCLREASKKTMPFRATISAYTASLWHVITVHNNATRYGR